MEKVVMFAKAKILPIGSVRKHGGSLYKKTAQGWKRVKKKGHIVKDKSIEKKIEKKRLQTIKKPSKSVAQTQKVRVKPRVKPEMVKQPIAKKISNIKKKVTLRTITEQYQDKIKQLSIMNKPGRLIFKKMIQQAIKDKDKEQLKLIFKDIDSWLFRNKQFKKKKNIRKKR